MSKLQISSSCLHTIALLLSHPESTVNSLYATFLTFHWNNLILKSKNVCHYEDICNHSWIKSVHIFCFVNKVWVYFFLVLICKSRKCVVTPNLSYNFNKYLRYVSWLSCCSVLPTANLESVMGPVIQANGRLTFEDDLRSGGLLYFTTQWTSVRTELADSMVNLGEPGGG